MCGVPYRHYMIAIKKLVIIDLPPHYVVVEKRDRSEAD